MESPDEQLERVVPLRSDDKELALLESAVLDDLEERDRLEVSTAPASDAEIPWLARRRRGDHRAIPTQRPRSIPPTS